MQKIQNKIKLIEKDIGILNNTGGGICLYKAISQFYNHTEEYHLYYRKKIAKYISWIYDIEPDK